MYLSNFGFEPTDLDDELFLTEVPLDLLEQTILAQFDEPLDDRKSDYVQAFITRYDFSKENGHEDDQYAYDEIYDEFMRFMIDTFKERLGVGFPGIDELDEDDALEIIQLSYRFFIRNMKKNFVTMIKRYIDENRPKVLSRLEHKKDVTTLNYRLEIDDEDDILILSNLGIVIEDFLNDVATTYDVDAFFNCCTGDSLSLEKEFVQSKYAQFRMTGNFVESYVRMVNADFRREIESIVRNHILKKYGNRRKNQIVTNPENADTLDTDTTNDDTTSN